MAKNLVVKDNALINASYNLELVEQRLVLLAIVEARATGKGVSPNSSLTITAGSYMNHFGTNRNTAYQALKDACDNIFNRQFRYIETNANGNVEVVRSRWVSEIRYIEQEASVKLIFAPTVAPLITLLEKNFTSYELEQVAELNSKYAVRLYEIVIAWRSTGRTPEISVDDLRQRLGVMPDEYLKMEVLKRKIIDFSIKQINEKTHITLNYEQHKQGRKIVGFTFTIRQKMLKVKKDKETVKKTVDIFAGFTELERGAIKKRINEYIQRLESQGETVGDWHRDNITQKAVGERWGLDVLEKEQAKIRAEQERREQELAQQRAEQERQARDKQQSEQRRQRVAELFDSLPPEQQEFILDEVAKKTTGIFIGIFKQSRTENKAHKHPMFIRYFEELLGVEKT